MNHELMSKAVYTTSEAAQLCHLSREIIRRHVEAGRLKTLRIPGSCKCRIPRESLLEFMRAQGLSTAALESASRPLPIEEFVTGPSGLLLNALEQEGQITQQDDGRTTSGSILEELPTDLFLELSPKVPGARFASSIAVVEEGRRTSEQEPTVANDLRVCSNLLHLTHGRFGRGRFLREQQTRWATYGSSSR